MSAAATLVRMGQLVTIFARSTAVLVTHATQASTVKLVSPPLLYNMTPSFKNRVADKHQHGHIPYPGTPGYQIASVTIKVIA